MEKEKISVAEIKQLRDAAEKERKTHHEIMEKISKISSVKISSDRLQDGLSAQEQMRIVERGNQKEIMALLAAYADLCISSYDAQRFENANVAPEVQMYIFRQPIGFDAVRMYMLEHNRLCLDVEKELIKKRMIHIITPKKLTPEAEVFFLTYCLQEGKKNNNASELLPVQEYISNNSLSVSGERTLMTYLSSGGSKESFLNTCRDCVKKYIEKYKELCVPAQRELVRSGDGELIMSYILFSAKGLAAEEELLERGNRAEVEAYFRRYATL